MLGKAIEPSRSRLRFLTTILRPLATDKKDMVESVESEKKGGLSKTMKQIILTAEQAQRVAEVREPIEVLDEQGRTVAHLTPLDPADIEAIARFREGRHRCGKGVPAADVRGAPESS